MRKYNQQKSLTSDISLCNKSLIYMRQRNVIEKCYREKLLRNVIEKCYREKSQRNVIEKCYRNVIEKCYREML